MARQTAKSTDLVLSERIPLGFFSDRESKTDRVWSNGWYPFTLALFLPTVAACTQSHELLSVESALRFRLVPNIACR